MMDRSHLNQKDMKNCKIVYKFVHKRCWKCPTFARTYAWRCFLHWSCNCSVDNVLSEIGP